MPTDTANPETKKKYTKVEHWQPWKAWMEKVRLRQAVTVEEVEEFLEQGLTQPMLSWDIETESLDPAPEKIVGHSVAFTGDEGIYIPVRHKVCPEQNLDPDEILQLILRHIVPPRILVVFNYKFEGECLKRTGVVRPPDHKYLRDGLIYNWLMDSNNKRLGLKDAVHNYFDVDMIELDEVPGCKRDKKKKGILDFSYTHPEDATLYAAADPVWTLRVLLHCMPIVQEQGFILDLEHRLIEPMFTIESNPVTIDRGFLRQGMVDLQRYIRTLEAEIYEQAGYQFNIGSPEEVGEYLVKQGIELKKTKTGKYATNAKEIERLADDHPVVERILLFRSLVKELSTYVKPLLEATTDDKPHTCFKIRSVGAPTGRFAAGGVAAGEIKYADMNVQSIPSASAFKMANARKVHNPPIAEMDAVLNIGRVIEEDHVGAFLEESDDDED